MRSSSGVRWGLLRRPREVGAARVEFAVIVAIFATWVMVSIAMFQQGVRDVYTAETGDTTLTGASSPAATPTTAASALVAAPTIQEPVPTTAAPTTVAPAAPAPMTAAPTTVAPAAPAAPARTTEAPPADAPAAPARTTEAPTTAAPAAAVPAPTTAAPTTAIPTTPAPATETPAPPPVAGPTLNLTASVAKKGTLAANLLLGFVPAGTLTAMDITSGGGDLVWTTAEGDYVFNAPNGKDTTVITFTYVQNAIPVMGNTLTIRTG